MHASEAREGIVVTLRGLFPAAQALYLFGSRARDVATPTSDWDVGLLLARAAPPLRVWEAGLQLADALGAEVDLVDLRAASTVLQHQAVVLGERLWQQGISGALFECFVAGEKCALDAARAAYLADIARRGTVYG